MKFERGRKKNQLIWSFILKDIASQSSVFNKTRKRKTFRYRIRFRGRGYVLEDIRFHLSQRGWRVGH